MAGRPGRARVAVLAVGALALGGAVLAGVTHPGPAPGAPAVAATTGPSADPPSRTGAAVAALLGGGTGGAGGPGAVPGDGPGRAAPASGPGTVIGPGTVTEIPGAGICTAGFVFTGGGRTLLGQAAHCAGTGPDTETDGCSSSALPPGTPVVIHGSGGPLTGTLRYSSWTAMRADGERDPDTCADNDFALVEVPDAVAGRTGASLPGLGGPAGLRDGPPASGDVVYALTGAGVAGEDQDGGWLHTVRTARPGVPGESGGPLVDDHGRALGILSGTTVGAHPALQYTDLARAVGYARAHGGPSDLALVAGPAAFDRPG